MLAIGFELPQQEFGLRQGLGASSDGSPQVEALARRDLDELARGLVHRQEIILLLSMALSLIPRVPTLAPVLALALKRLLQ